MNEKRHTFTEVEYDRELIERSLFYGGYDLSKIDVDMISVAPMAGFAVSSKEKPLLYTFGLQCCIGLLATSEGLGFLAHVSTELIDDSDYEVDEKLNPVKFKRIEDLYNYIMNNNKLITEPIKINLAIGSNPIPETSKSKILILEAINELIFKLKTLGINAYYDGEFYQGSFIFDTVNNKFILPNKEAKL